MTNTRKSLVTIKIVDVFGNPIAKAQYQVKNQKTGQLIAAGSTNTVGCIVEISRDKGTVLDVYVKSMFNGIMIKVQSFAMTKDRMLVKIASPKLLLDLKTLNNQGASGNYIRKTHTVKKGENLTGIAQKYKTTVRALERLNKIDDPNRIYVGQVIKLPVDIPATGNHTHQEKASTTQRAGSTPKSTTSQKTQPSSQPQSTRTTPTKPNQDGGVMGTLEGWGNKAFEKANEAYEQGKQALNELADGAAKIFTVEDRSQEGGTPKANVPNLCKTNPQCIASGKSELIREVNIRLAGFGGALPTDEFTELTAKCIKQFQRDYMGVPDTGKICGSVLAALDKFYYEYPISGFMAKASCPCGKCTGYGNNRRGVRSGSNMANEYPGIHRSLIWILKALNFYLKNEFKSRKLEVAYIESGYRCIEHNKQKSRTSVNHMGLALDLHINKNGSRTRELSDMEFIRKNVMAVKMGATEQRATNKIYLEPKVFNNGDSGATTWVHFDITRLQTSYFADHFFKKSVTDLNGRSLVEIVGRLNLNQILGCAGIAATSNNVAKISDKTIDELVIELGDAIASGEGSYEAWNAGAPEGKRVKFGKMNDTLGTITGKTINQLLDAAKNYTWQDNRRRFATGKYQTIPSTLAAAKKRMNLSGNELYDANMQERVFKEHLLRGRSAIYNLIDKGTGTVDQAMIDASKEWASIALPKGSKNKFGVISDGTIGYHQSGTNRANSHSTAKVRQIFEKIKQHHSVK
ncbi:LysM domain-containing protein [Acinetobacter sp. YH12049]|uniref:LysM peptidoglycan-binding domain-containing protein n=1 Tax=Acinetobacter sp. YH12049 TaxID=2601054 RepID=UPI0015D0D4D6|nr:LysM peptidoglycan-binding domain-containing protein [Acinetobacter sp. YH12049]